MPDKPNHQEQIIYLQAKIWELEDLVLTLIAGAFEEDVDREVFWEMVGERKQERIAEVRRAQEEREARLN